MCKAIFEFRNKLTNVIHFVCVIKLSVRLPSQAFAALSLDKTSALDDDVHSGLLISLELCIVQFSYDGSSAQARSISTQLGQQQRRVCHNLETDDSTINFRRYSSGSGQKGPFPQNCQVENRCNLRGSL